MGGTFNPIHNAHLMMAQAAYEQYKLDEIWFMPSAKPPHKNQDEIAEKEHRKRMVQFAIDKTPYFHSLPTPLYFLPLAVQFFSLF